MKTNEGKQFNPAEYLIKITKNQKQPNGTYKPIVQEYLEVKWRIYWFRTEHSNWSIETEPLEINTEKQYVIFRAIVKDDKGRVIATATKVETKNGFNDYLEKAETGSVGRALALCGYGSQFAPELEEGNKVVDAPIHNHG